MNHKILIVDDIEENLVIFAKMLKVIENDDEHIKAAYEAVAVDFLTKTIYA